MATTTVEHYPGPALRLAYADPVYVGCSGRYDHPAASVWDDVERHGALMRQLNRDYDGWALSASAPSLLKLAALVPDGARVGVWVKPFAAFKRNVRIAYTWEPVIWRPARDSSAAGAPVGRDHIAEVITLRRGLVGAKPERVCSWVLDLMGYVPGDSVVDVFPGTGSMGRAVAARERNERRARRSIRYAECQCGCGAALEWAGVGRRPLYASAACRVRAHRRSA